MSTDIFVSDLPSYGLIGLMIIGLILYVSYMISYIRNTHPLSTVYIYLSQLSLLLVLISSTTFLIRPTAAIPLVCGIQNLSLQIFPFFFYLVLIFILFINGFIKLRLMHRENLV